jgi:hypothetical protein
VKSLLLLGKPSFYKSTLNVSKFGFEQPLVSLNILSTNKDRQCPLLSMPSSY